jgi:hypothetical protein
MLQKSSTEIDEPHFALEHMDKVDPMRAKHLTDSCEPSVTLSSTLIELQSLKA